MAERDKRVWVDMFKGHDMTVAAILMIHRLSFVAVSTKSYVGLKVDFLPSSGGHSQPATILQAAEELPYFRLE